MVIRQKRIVSGVIISYTYSVTQAVRKSKIEVKLK